MIVGLGWNQILQSLDSIRLPLNEGKTQLKITVLIIDFSITLSCEINKIFLHNLKCVKMSDKRT